MILFDDWTLSITGEVIARQYDNLSRRIEVLGNLPDGWYWSLLVQVGDAMDIIYMEPTEGGVGITLNRNQLALGNRHYELQLRGMKGEQVRHTNIITTFIPQSISGDSQWPEVPSEFTQIEQRVHEAAQRAEDAATRAENSGGSGGGISFVTDETLTLKDGVLSVNTADVAEKDNTLPITSAAVAAQVGNIELILETI